MWRCSPLARLPLIGRKCRSMRIIKKGVKPEQVARFECDVCGTIFEEDTDSGAYTTSLSFTNAVALYAIMMFLKKVIRSRKSRSKAYIMLLGKNRR